MPGQSDDDLFGFPCAFPLKVMGLADAALVQAVVEILLVQVPDFDTATIEQRFSSAGKYLSLTCTINATSREQLDALYRELSSHPLVKIVL